MNSIHNLFTCNRIFTLLLYWEKLKELTDTTVKRTELWRWSFSLRFRSHSWEGRVVVGVGVVVHHGGQEAKCGANCQRALGEVWTQLLLQVMKHSQAALPHPPPDLCFLFPHLFSCSSSLVVRFDYEGLDPRAAFYLMRDLETVISDKAFTSQKFAVGDHIYSVERAENFEYIDPVDGTVARNQVSVVNSGNAGCQVTVRERMFLLTLLFPKKQDWNHLYSPLLFYISENVSVFLQLVYMYVKMSLIYLKFTLKYSS